ncbi:dienelactone hydrolase family protein [Qipengyuania zhejiangensis]|uniref:dienelactone hydrolase family protein n=1 Tax=Qipengyuania zhejiangensis TaxID=3077782 RepID=UPI002D77CC24|nr:dienelactone hydrolase family protein [Qipengyuania sp. Z2]
MTELTPVSYRDGAVDLTALHGRPAGTVRGAVAIFPTFMNSTPGVEAKARALIAEGFAVLIADFYGPQAPRDFEQAFAAMRHLRSDPCAMRARLHASIDLMRRLEPDLPQLAIGFCLGGMAVLELARDGADLLLVASFHGLLETPLPAEKPISARILVCHGDADALVPRGHVLEFWEEMDGINADWHFHSYSGVEHGFTNPAMLDGSPNPAYDASADRQSWSALLSLLDEMIG